MTKNKDLKFVGLGAEPPPDAGVPFPAGTSRRPDAIAGGSKAGKSTARKARKPTEAERRYEQEKAAKREANYEDWGPRGLCVKCGRRIGGDSNRELVEDRIGPRGRLIRFFQHRNCAATGVKVIPSAIETHPRRH